MQEVLDTKFAVGRPSLVRLDNVSMGKTAVKEVHHVFNDYLQNSPRNPKDYEESVWEDVDFLVEQFNETIGSTWSEVRQPRTANRFSGRGMTSATSGAAKMKEVHEEMPGWLEYLKSTNIIFDEPDIERVVADHNVVIELAEDLEPEPAPAEDVGPPIASNSARKWCDGHDPRNGETKEEQLDQAGSLMSRGLSRHQLLWEKKQEELAIQAVAKEAHEVQQAVRAVARSERQHKVEMILNKRVIDGHVQYRVKWEGHSSACNTWEPVDNLVGARAAVALYEKKHKNKN